MKSYFRETVLKPRPKTKRKKTEHIQQAMLFQWLDSMSHQHPELNLAFAIPNGGSRNVIEAVNLKREGVKAGVPDIFIPVPNGEYHGLFIEMKQEKGEVQPNQKEWIRKLTEQGYKAEVCFGFEEAKDLITSYLEGS